ncbi:SulP family inorganic anion transporter [Nocardioides mangrovi]|uniref:SulP family inorganic anion transporter n=1 Tax=Nocardioides mangrovi TaxID=2874580 RepID=A0ABS7UBJ4_9ACTN|nr:SulP family inorganic anion transporter [Nocardioides mangrovi]MBZ5738240.1 SulP family inorganic anion transporter [Nocardioides mangrovi]
MSPVGRRVRGRLRDLRPRRADLRADLVAGLPRAIGSVPDGMAASVLAGLSPTHGLYASFAGPIAGGLSTSTRLMVITTTSAAALAAGSTLAEVDRAERADAMLWLTLVAGALMIAAAVLRLDRFIHFVSYSVMLGFLGGIATNIVLGQLPTLLGSPTEGGVAVQKAWYVVTHPGGVHLATAACGLGALALLVGLGRTRWATYGALVALVVPTAVVWLTDASTVARVSDGGAIPTGLPTPGLPSPGAFSLSLLVGAASVAAIVLVQGAGVAEALPSPDGSRSSGRQDFAAQGVGNLAAGLVGGQVVGGSVSQSALNVAAGARSRWASVFSGCWMLAILLIFSGLVGRVAMPTLAAVLVFAGWSTIRPAELWSVARAGSIPAIAMVCTFVAVLALPVAEAVGVGLAASLLMQLNREALDLRVVRLRLDDRGRLVQEPAPSRLLPYDVLVLDVYGSLFFAGTRTLQRQLPPPPAAKAGPPGHGPVVVLRLRGRSTLGSTFLKMIGDYAHQLAAVDGALYLSGVDAALVRRWDRDGTTRAYGNVRVFEATPVIGESTTFAIQVGRTHRVSPGS